MTDEVSFTPLVREGPDRDIGAEEIVNVGDNDVSRYTKARDKVGSIFISLWF